VQHKSLSDFWRVGGESEKIRLRDQSRLDQRKASGSQKTLYSGASWMQRANMKFVPINPLRTPTGEFHPPPHSDFHPKVLARA